MAEEARWIIYLPYRVCLRNSIFEAPKLFSLGRFEHLLCSSRHKPTVSTSPSTPTGSRIVHDSLIHHLSVNLIRPAGMMPKHAYGFRDLFMPRRGGEWSATVARLDRSEDVAVRLQLARRVCAAGPPRVERFGGAPRAGEDAARGVDGREGGSEGAGLMLVREVVEL